jgi:hypothetical protein
MFGERKTDLGGVPSPLRSAEAAQSTTTLRRPKRLPGARAAAAVAGAAQAGAAQARQRIREAGILQFESKCVAQSSD